MLVSIGTRRITMLASLYHRFCIHAIKPKHFFITFNIQWICQPNRETTQPMSSGAFIDTVYESRAGLFFPMRVQPETLTLTLNSVVNDAPTGTAGLGLPSASVSRGRKSNGVNARLVRIRTPNTGGDPNYVPLGVIALPVPDPVSFDAFGKGQTGTYSINGSDIAVEFVGKTPETIV